MTGNLLRGPDFIHPLDEGTIGQFFFNYAEKYKDRICQIDGTTHLSETYGSVKLRSTRVAIALQEKGITPSDVIAICCPNTLDNTVPMLAAFYLGAKVSNLHSLSAVDHIKHLLRLVTPRMIFVEESAVGLIEESVLGIEPQPEIIVFGSSEKYHCFSEFLQPRENEEDFQPVKVDVDDVALLLFSSGTSGPSKAISHTHRSFLYIALQIYQCYLGGCLYHYTPFYWITAFMSITSCFKVGSFRVFSRDADTENIFRIIEKYKLSILVLSPVLSHAVSYFQDAKKYDTSSLKIWLCVGSTIAESEIQKMYTRFPDVMVSIPYGMTEVGSVTYFNPELEKDLAKRKLYSCGKPAPGVVMKVVDSTTEELLGPNKRGEIRLKAPSMMKGYYRGDSTQVFDTEDFLKTGDTGYYDAEGCVVVVGRTKEVFKYKSWHVIPSFVEAVLLQHPGIEEAVVFDLPHLVDGDVPAASLVLKRGVELSEEDVDAFLKERVSDSERLRGGVTFINDVPRTATGKIIRNEVREIFIKTRGYCSSTSS